MNDRLIDRVQQEDWVNLTDDINKVVAGKLVDKIETYKDELRTNGSLGLPKG